MALGLIVLLNESANGLIILLTASTVNTPVLIDSTNLLVGVLTKLGRTSFRYNINNIMVNLKEIGYSKKSIKWLAPRIKRNEMFEILSEYEKEVVEEFAMLHDSPYARLHDAIVTYTKAHVSIKEHFEAKGIRFGGDFDKTPRTVLTPRQKAEQLVREFKGL